MKNNFTNFNLIERLWTDSHEKQRVRGMRRYAAMITLLLTLACGQAWGATTTMPTSGSYSNATTKYAFSNSAVTGGYIYIANRTTVAVAAAYGWRPYNTGIGMQVSGPVQLTYTIKSNTTDARTITGRSYAATDVLWSVWKNTTASTQTLENYVIAVNAKAAGSRTDEEAAIAANGKLKTITGNGDNNKKMLILEDKFDATLATAHGRSISHACPTTKGGSNLLKDTLTAAGKYVIYLTSSNGSIGIASIDVVPFYTVTHSLTNVTKSSGSTGSLAALSGSAYNAVFAAADGYTLPSTISVTIGGKDSTSACTWNNSTGALSIPARSVTGAIVVTIAGEAASAGCSDWGLHYGTDGETDWSEECFSQVGETSEWQITDFVIPNKPNWYVDNAAGDDAKKHLETWSGLYFALSQGDGARPMVGAATGAVGTVRIYDNSNWNNRYAGFIPNGYVLKFGTTEKAFAVETGNEYRSELVEYNSTSVAYDVSVGIEDENGDYVASDNTAAMRHIFLNTGGTSYWSTGGATNFALYDDTDGHKYFTCLMVAVPGEDYLYEGWVPTTCSKIIICRMASSTLDWGEDNSNVWNYVESQSLPNDKNLFTIEAWSTGSWSAYERKGKFRMNADWTDKNWYVRFFPYYVLTYDKNHAGASGSMDEQGVAVDAVSKSVTIQANDFTPPTGYTFNTWKTGPSSGTSYAPNASYTLSADATLYAQWSPKQCTVTFDNNGGTGTITSVTATYDAAMPSKAGNLPTKSGYDFAGFWDGEGGTGTQYYNADGTSAQNWDKNTTSTTTLYAKWTAHTYTVTLDADYTSGTITPATLSPAYNNDLGTKAVISSASRSNWTYGGFFTGHGGTGTQVIGADKKWVKSVEGWTDGTPKWIHTSDETLYAHWYRTQTIDDNGGSADGNVVANYKGTMGTITAPTYAGCTPDGYYAQAACNTLVMAADGTLESDVTNWTSSDRKWIQTGTSKLYAHYKIDAPTISCSRNEVTISTTLAGTTIYYTTNGSDPTTSSTVYTAPFSIAANTTVKAYAVKSNFTDSDPASASCTYETTYDVSYDANLDGASGSTTSQTGNFTDDQVTTKSCGFSKDGYKFKWWNTDDEGEGEDFYVGEKVTIATSDVTLYAQWEEIDTDEAFWVGDVAITDAATAYDVTGNGVTMQITRESSADWNDDINQTWNQVSKHSSTAKKAKVLAIDADDSYIEVKFKDGGTINELNLGVTSDQTTDQNIVVCYSTTADFSTGEYEFVKVGSTDNVVSVPGHNQSTKSVTDVSPSTKDKYRYVRIYRKLKNGSGYNSTGAALGSSAKARIYSIKAKKGISCATSPTVTDGSNSSVAATTATVTCALGISSLGSEGCEISSYGFVLGTSSTPTIDDDTQYEVGTTYTTKDVSFYKDLTGLTEGTTYYVRPYATNGNGTSYGTQTSFTTHYAITTGSHTNGSVTIPASAASSATVNISATGDTGYGFTSWTIINTSTEADVTTTLLGDNKTTASTSFTMPSYGVTLSATFTAMTYDITYNLNSASWASEEGVDEYTYGTGATLPTASDLSYDGYRFMGWYDNSGLTGSPVEEIGTSETGNKEYWAKWAQLYTITTGTHTYGSIAITNSSSAVITQAIEGETVSIDATAGTHYAFSEWSIYKTSDAETTVSPAAATATTSFTMPAYGVTVNATFAIESLTLAYAAGGATGSAPTNPAAGSIAYGTEITVPDSGSYAKSTDAFVGWLYNGTTLYTTGQKFTMTENVTLTAVWNTACAGGSETLFSQNFNSATALSYRYVSGTTTQEYSYSASGTTLSGLVGTGSNLFTHFESSIKKGDIAINSSTGGNSVDATGFFQAYARGDNTAYWSLTRTTDFAATAPTALEVTMDIYYTNGSSGSTNGVQFAIGDGFTGGLVSTSAEASTNVHSGFGIYANSSAVLNQYGTTTSISGKTTITQSSWLSIAWIINNTGDDLTYDNPTGSGTTTLPNDKFDVWIKAQDGADNTYSKIVSEAAATTATKDLQEIYIGYNNTGKQHEFRLDNIVVTDLTSSGSDCKFDVSFANESGFAGGATVTLPSTIEGVPTGKKIAQPADPTTTGDYVFGGWFCDAACENAFDFSGTITKDTTLYAKWYAADYTITWMVNGETYATTKACDDVTTIVLPAAPADNTLDGCANSFRGWSATNLYGASGQSVPTDLFVDAAGAPTITKDTIFYAVFGDDASELSTSFTTTFDRKDWNDANSKWASGKDGTNYTSDRGVKVETGATGATATTKAEYKAVTSVVVTYSTNASNGAGSIDIKVGGTAMIGNADVTKTGGTTDRTITYTPVSALNGKVKITVNTTENSIFIKSVQIYHSGSFENYRCICPSLEVTPELITASTPIFITSAASKTVRSQDSLVIVGSGLQKEATLSLSGVGTKFVLKSRTNTDLTTDETGAISAVGYIFYTPDAGDTSDGLDKSASFTVTDGSNDTIVDQALIGRHLPADFVIAVKRNNKWLALPATMNELSTPSPVEIAVDNIDNPTVAYTANTNIYNLYGQSSGAGYLEEAGQYIKLGMKNNSNKPLFGSTSSTVKGDGDATVTNNLGKQYWWLLTQTKTGDVTTSTAQYSISCANNANPFVLKENAGNPQWGFYSTGSVGPIRIIPAVSGVGFAEAEIVAWGKNSAIVEVDNSTMIADYAIAKLPEDIESPHVTLSQTRTSVKNTGTRYNYTMNFGVGVDFSANEGKMLTLEWYDALNTLKAISNIMVPRIVAANTTINSSNYSNKSDWNKEVHVLPGDTVTIDASGYSGKNITIKELVIYPGARVVVQNDTLITPTLVLRNGWNRLTAEKEYNVSQLYIPSAGSVKATNAYADWYIDYDQYYPIAVPWKVATANISYRNMTVDIDQGLMVRYYNGERRAGRVVDEAKTNWTDYTWGVGGTIPTYLEPGIGYAITARRPAGKAFSIIRMPLTIPSAAWTKAGEQGYVSDTHKDEVTVTAWEKDDGKTPEYAKGWNFVANPYMASYEGEIAFTPDSDPGEEYDDDIAYVNIPDVDFKEFDQVATATTELKPGCGFLIQTKYDGKITFASSSRKASAPAYRREAPSMSKQKAYIMLRGEEAVDQMGLIIADRYTEDYEVNADLEKLLSVGNSLRTYMQYNDLNMAYIAINSTLAQEWIPVSVRIPATGEYTYTIHHASRVSELEGLYLIDYETNEITNLIESDYVFTATAGTITDRFALNAVVGERQTPTDIDVVQGGGDLRTDQPVKFMYHDKIYIYYRGIIYDTAGKKVAERRAAL